MIRGRGIATVVLVAAGLLSACGDDQSGGDAKKGGSITIGTVGPGSYDPAEIASSQAVEALQLVYTGLTTFKHVEGDGGAEIVPGLAEDLPEISGDGKTYRLKLRSGLKYSDGTPVKASDFEHTIKRLVALESAFIPFFDGIEGADEFAKDAKESGDISGIVTDDRTGDITIKLTAPDGKFVYALSEPYAAPLPASKASFKAMSSDPPPGIGPYNLKVEDPTRSFVLTQNKSFDIAGLPKGNLERIDAEIVQSVSRMTQNVIRNKWDYMTEDPAGQLLPQVRTKNKDRFREDPFPPNTYYFFLNVEKTPFNNSDARKAANFALDSRALTRVFGGRLEPGCTVLPPGVTGHESGECPYGNPDGPADLDRARELVQKSGTKGEKVTVWTDNKEPRPAIGQYWADALKQIGYDTELKTLDSAVYFENVAKAEAQTGFSSWVQDFPHPASFLESLVSGDAAGVTNLSLVKDKQVDQTLERLTAQPSLDDSAEDWAALDREVVEKAYLAPYGHEKLTTFMSERMDHDSCSGVHPVWKNDWSLFCLK